MNEKECRNIIAEWEAVQGSNYPVQYREAKAFLAGIESERKRAGKLVQALWSDFNYLKCPIDDCDCTIVYIDLAIKALAEYEHPTGDEEGK